MLLVKKKHVNILNENDKGVDSFSNTLERANLIGSQYQKKKCLVLSGPTGVGKSSVSLDLAKMIGGEVISFDSMQVYRGMDIGTAKVSPLEQEEVVHHLIDICDIKDPFNVVDYIQLAKKVFNQIIARGKIPILVGGTGFYIRSFLYGPPEGPAKDKEVRSRLQEDCDKFGPELLYEKLQKVDPEYAKTITRSDQQKIIRALEIMLISKRRVSDYKIEKQTFIDKDVDYRCWFFYYPREILYERAERRCDLMLEVGLIEEVEDLIKEGLCENESTSRAIGYRQCIDYIENGKRREDWDTFVKEFKKATRRYIKRQFTWFRSEEAFNWLNFANMDRKGICKLILDDFFS